MANYIKKCLTLCVLLLKIWISVFSHLLFSYNMMLTSALFWDCTQCGMVVGSSLILERGTDRLARNVGQKPSFFVAWNTRWTQISFTTRRKPEVGGIVKFIKSNWIKSSNQLWWFVTWCNAQISIAVLRTDEVYVIDRQCCVRRLRGQDTIQGRYWPSLPDIIPWEDIFI